VVLVTRPSGTVFGSDDNGVTWSKIGNVGHAGQVISPDLVCLPDGTLVCVISYGHVYLSKDGGKNWKSGGRLLSVYGYPGCCLLPDGTIHTVLYHPLDGTQFKTQVQAISFRVRPDRQSIQLVPFPGSAAAQEGGPPRPPEDAGKGKPLDLDALGPVEKSKDSSRKK
jgi:hypothetical protein